MALSAGTQLGPYQILSAIGAGGMGEVYKARDVRLDRIVAVKVLPEHLSSNTERRQRFEREARIVSRLNHPYICVLHDIGHEGGTDFLVMEYLEGETLAERLRRGALPLAEVLRYAIQIVDALAKAHQSGIVHRDLKPGNIIVTRDGVAKVLDFGLATVSETPAFEEFGTTESEAPQLRTEEGKIVGTVAYMSPEQAEGIRVDARSDIFSFGSLLYELVTGQRPFQGDTRLATLSLILHQKPKAACELAPDVPVGLDKAILRCLAKDPSQRFQYIIELKAVLDRVTAEWEGQPANDRLVAPRQAAPLADDVRKWSFRAGAVLILGSALVLAMMYYREREQSRNLRQVAAEAFYQMRALDADLVGLRQRGSSSNDLARASYRRDQLEREYDRYLDLVGSYAGKSPTERAVMRLGRRLGETDLDVPPDFYTLSMKHVDKWRTTDSARLRGALSRARQGNLILRIRSALDQLALPSELSFLPLQESDFNSAAVGRQTPAGVPKGLWQFTPTLAKAYGLTLGPLSDTPDHDALDDRHDADRSTAAAVRYLADLYSSKAAASGLLVIASYTLGPGPVIKKLDELPNDPRDRNFWNFYRNNWLPDETLDYVMSVFAVALICQEPELFNVPIERF